MASENAGTDDSNALCLFGQTEQRLGVRLPPSYREFLQVTNGWVTVGELTARLWSTAELDWFRIGNRDWIDGWLEGVQHGAEKYGASLEVPDEVYYHRPFAR